MQEGLQFLPEEVTIDLSLQSMTPILSKSARHLMVGIALCLALFPPAVNALDNADDLQPGESPEDAATLWLNAIQSDLELESIVDSPLMIISPYCPEEKREEYLEKLASLRQSLRALDIIDGTIQSFSNGKFGGVVTILGKAGEPISRTAIAVASVREEAHWRIPIGVRHFDNINYGFDLALRHNQSEVARDLAQLRVTVSRKSEERITDETLPTIEDARERLQLASMNTVMPAFEAFYDSLSDEQKAQVNKAGGKKGRPGMEHENGERKGQKGHWGKDGKGPRGQKGQSAPAPTNG